MKRVWVAAGEAILSDRWSEPGGSKSAVEPGSSKTRAEAENGSGVIVNVLISFGRASARDIKVTVSHAKTKDRAAHIVIMSNSWRISVGQRWCEPMDY